MSRPCWKHDKIAIGYCRLYRLNFIYSIIFEEKQSPSMLNSSVLLTKYPIACHKSDVSQSLAIKCKFSLTEGSYIGPTGNSRPNLKDCVANLWRLCSEGQGGIEEN